MNYCKFENTYEDLAECEEVLQEVDSLEELKEKLSEKEFRFAKRLIKTCIDIAAAFLNEMEEDT
jgi:hypothetical protein